MLAPSAVIVERIDADICSPFQKQRILPIRTLSSTYCNNHYRHNPAPEDSPVIPHPEPSTLTPAESEEGDAESCLYQASIQAGIPTISTQGPTISAQGLMARNAEDLDMDDSSPLPTPARPELLSPLNISNRMPTPRYGSFLLRPPAQHSGYDVAMKGVEEGIVRAMGMSSLNPVMEHRVLPSPITESLPRSAGYDREDTAMEVMTPSRTDDATMWPPKKEDHRPRTGKPMLVMGFRADCEKCRARVPGHYSHILRS